MQLFEDSEATLDIQGVVDWITFRNEDNGWTVFKMTLDKVIPGVGAKIMVTCNTPEIKENEFVRVGGKFVRHPKFGMQLKADFVMPILPKTSEGILHLLKTGFLPVTPVVAKRLVDAFGVDLFSVIEKTPGELLNIKGIHATATRKNMKNNILPKIIEEMRHKRNVIAFHEFFARYGISLAFSTRIYNTFGENAVKIVQVDPYKITEVPLIGFLKADEFARNMGIPFDDKRRLVAGIKHALTADDIVCGSAGLPVDRFLKAAVKLLSVPEQLINDTVLELLNEKVVFKDVVDGEECLFYYRNYQREQRIASELCRLCSGKMLYDPAVVDEAITVGEKLIEKEMTRQGEKYFALETSQREALARSLKHKVSIITGGPGVGKTTIIKTMIAAITYLRGVSVSLAAPTGRASRRMAEQTGCVAKTIHRLLKPTPKPNRFGGMSFSFEFCKDNKLDGDTIYVIDESSMIEDFVAEKLMEALPDDCHVVFVGDIDQLPPVGLGQVFADMIASDRIAVSRLTYNFRQEMGSLITENAHSINAGRFPNIANAKGRDFFFAETEEPSKCAGIIQKCVTEAIPKKFGYSGVDSIQVLAPSKEGVVGTKALNSTLQLAMNPLAADYIRWEFLSEHKAAWSQDDVDFMNAHPIKPLGVYKDKFRMFCEGDKVMQMKNNYDLGVFNGEVGKIERVDGFKKQIFVSYDPVGDDERVIAYKMDSSLNQISLAYACTIHKSQGSEYDVVVIPLMMQNYIMLSRRLLYTAVTRGRKLVVLVGQKDAIRIAVRNNNSQKRYTKLRDFLRDGMERESFVG